MTDLSTQRNFELLPTFTAVSSGRLNAITGEYGTDHVEEGGIGLKYGINSNLTFDFTYNPDFSHDRIRNAADRNQPALPDQLSGAASVLPRGP